MESMVDSEIFNAFRWLTSIDDEIHICQVVGSNDIK